MKLAAQIRELGFWPPDDLASEHLLQELSSTCSEPKQLAHELIKRDLLTPFQANQLLTGKGPSLLIGPYVILDRLGEGGMGKVYKARHRKLQRVVALKVIHPERVANPVAVERFFREIRAVGRLKHPNIVWAIDADQTGPVTYFVMEYVPGVNLSRLVKQTGPLDMASACDFIRQAARGLQHIADCGMVHRDIKPSNLLICNRVDQAGKSGSGVAVKTQLVKIVDLGLIRDPDVQNAQLTVLTQENTLMGTPDYIAPEQALRSHKADIRSDIYSLGCTLFYALIGRAPFGGDTLMQKVMAHQIDPPEALDQLRPEIPPTLTAVVHRMMAKKPAERYQTPSEVAQVLELFARGQAVPVALPVAASSPVPSPIVPSPPVQPEVFVQTNSMFQFGETATEVPRVLAPTSATRLPSKPLEKWLWLRIAGAAAAVLVILLLLLKLILH